MSLRDWSKCVEPDLPVDLRTLCTCTPDLPVDLRTLCTCTPALPVDLRTLCTCTDTLPGYSRKCLTINRGYSYPKVVPKDAETVRGENRSRRSKTPRVQNERTAAITKDSNGRASKARRSKRAKCHPREFHTLSLLAIRGSHRGARDIVGDNSRHELVLGLPASGDVLVRWLLELSNPAL